MKVIVGEGKSFDEILEEEIKPIPAKTDVVRQLEERAAHGLKVERRQSGYEEEWIQQLITKHRRDYEAMFWDKKLNPYQQTAAQLKRKVETYMKKAK